MVYIKRDMEDLILQLNKEYSCILITGPRQVGKTTMLEHIKPQNMQSVTLDDLSERQLAKNDPELFLSMHPAPVLIDEVQYAPELFSYIKIAIDKGAPAGSFWLTGSQAFKLMTHSPFAFVFHVSTRIIRDGNFFPFFGRRSCFAIAQRYSYFCGRK